MTTKEMLQKAYNAKTQDSRDVIYINDDDRATAEKLQDKGFGCLTTAGFSFAFRIWPEGIAHIEG